MSAVIVNDVQDIVRFLLDRIDEQESVFRRGGRARGDAVEHPDLEQLQAETNSKRRIIGTAQQLLVLRDLPNEKVVREAAAQIIKELALPYADHPAYRPEWRASQRL